jgi:hypothetical protein
MQGLQFEDYIWRKVTEKILPKKYTKYMFSFWNFLCWMFWVNITWKLKLMIDMNITLCVMLFKFYPRNFHPS